MIISVVINCILASPINNGSWFECTGAMSGDVYQWLICYRIPEVCFLECDIGQTEFTPPGCISLQVVSSPVLGLSSLNQKWYYLYKRMNVVNDMSI